MNLLYRIWDNEKKIFFESGFDWVFTYKGFGISICTGVLDINKKKIFESDIISILDTKGDEVIRGEVKYDQDDCAFKIKVGDRLYNLKFDNSYLVLGNIFENPELLICQKS